MIKRIKRYLENRRVDRYNDKVRAKGRELADQLAYDVMVGLIVHNDTHSQTAARKAFEAHMDFWDKYCLFNEII